MTIGTDILSHYMIPHNACWCQLASPKHMLLHENYYTCVLCCVISLVTFCLCLVHRMNVAEVIFHHHPINIQNCRTDLLQFTMYEQRKISSFVNIYWPIILLRVEKAKL